jgi:hypothetical protein
VVVRLAAVEVVLVRLVHHSVSVAVEVVLAARLQAVMAVREVLVQVVAVVVVQTVTMTAVLVVLVVTHKSRFGYSDEMA